MSLLSTYDPHWVEDFARESEQLAKSFGDLALRIEHVGSTSIPHPDAKPVIDIQISVARVQPMDEFEKILAELGYRHLPLPDPGVDVYPFFHKPNRWPTTHHVHLCKIGAEQERKHLAFRDWLREYPAERDAYAQLKYALALEVDGSDLGSLMKYTMGKSNWIVSTTERALDEGYGK